MMESRWLATLPGRGLESNATSTVSLPSQITSLAEEKSQPLLITYPLPAERVDNKPFRKLRHAIFTVYYRLFTLVIVANIIGLVFIDHRRRDNTSYIKVSSSVRLHTYSLLMRTPRLSRLQLLVISLSPLPCVKTTLSTSSVRSSLQLPRAHHSGSAASWLKSLNSVASTQVLRSAPLHGSYASQSISP